MRRTWIVGVVAVVLGVAWGASAVRAQEMKTARGAVTTVAGDSLSIKAGDRVMTFAVDAKTELIASGAGTASRRAEAAGKPGPRLSDFLKAGDAVEVRYAEGASGMRASRVSKVSSAGPGGGSTSDTAAQTSQGTVSSVSGTTLTISGNISGGGTFTQSFTVDRTTRVVASGAGTASQASDGVTLTQFVGTGDTVSVRYRKAGDTLHAEEVRVTAKRK
jgi:hypothetical protein